MPYTRAQAEAELVNRAGDDLLARLGVSAVQDGTNPDLNGPLASSLRMLDATLSSPPAVADADLALVADADTDQFLDVAELRMVLNLQLKAATLVDQQIGTQSRKNLHQIMESLELVADRLQKRIEKLYGVGRGRLVAGMIRYPVAVPPCREEF